MEQCKIDASMLPEYIIFGLLVISNLGLGLYFAFSKRRGKTSLDEIFLANRQIRTAPLALSVLASTMSASGIVGSTAHYYAYGFHFIWSVGAKLLVLPIAMYVVVPLLYGLKMTSIFEYLRMRYGNKTGLGVCCLYMFLSQSLGAAALYSASVAVSTAFSVPIIWVTLTMGFVGTLYTALGGLRAVVWTDCVQALAMLLCPLTVISKVIYDAHQPRFRLRPFNELNLKDYILRTNLSLTEDENVWACLIGLMASGLNREGLDQMMVQRYMAARTPIEARRTALFGTALTLIYMVLMSLMALALLYWYHDCDPLMTGHISKLDQILPYYVHKELKIFPSFTALFLAGVVSSTLSTISSAINTQVAVCFVDGVMPFFNVKDVLAVKLTKCIAHEEDNKRRKVILAGAAVLQS
ncbi:sodium/iodide cotransporter [Ixodes scapularis]|uniref:sodium/iodide cotransporter n=1 Tax=Ixodes scapularis TaxID=6945 RepID=UPI001C386963|nr:sodium/iodide cotransporter [Ixodes scapularis]